MKYVSHNSYDYIYTKTEEDESMVGFAIGVCIGFIAGFGACALFVMSKEASKDEEI